MKCMFCDSPATVHLTDIVNKKKREAHLCEQCARERNLASRPARPADRSQGAHESLMTPFRQSETGSNCPPQAVCPACGLTYAAFKAEGRFGCAHDYDAFVQCSNRFSSAVHRATAHAASCRVTACGARLRELEAPRASAMKSAAAETRTTKQAARLRDLIRQKEAEGTPG